MSFNTNNQLYFTILLLSKNSQKKKTLLYITFLLKGLKMFVTLSDYKKRCDSVIKIAQEISKAYNKERMKKLIIQQINKEIKKNNLLKIIFFNLASTLPESASYFQGDSSTHK